MFIPDSIVTSFSYLQAEQIRNIVNAVRAFQEGQPVAMESFDSAEAIVWNMALPELTEEKRHREDVAAKRRNAGMQSHKNRSNKSYQMISNANICYQMISNDSKCYEPTDSQLVTEVLDEKLCEEKEQEENLSSLFPSDSLSLNTLKEEKEKEKEVKESSAKPKSKIKEEEFLATAEPQSLVPVMREWLAYKREKGQTYKPIGLKGCFNNLILLSGGDVDKARKIVHQSISNNYAGLFELKVQQTPTQKQPTYIPFDNEKTREKVKAFFNPYDND